MRIRIRLSVRTFSTLLAACLAMGLPAGCRPHGSNDREVEVSLWSMWTGQEELNFNRVLRRYEALHPGIKIHNLGAVTDDTKTIRALVAGVPPDIFTLADNSYLGPLARNGALRRLDTLFTQSRLDPAGFVPVALDFCKYRGDLYGLPFLIDDVALMWNKDMFAESGLDPKRPPRTLEELADYAVKMTRYDKDGNITRLGMRPLDDLYIIIALSGGRLYDPVTRRITADDPANVAAFVWYKKLVDRLGGIEKIRAFTSGFGRDQGISNPFFSGKVAIQFAGEWTPYWASRYAPQLKYGIAPVPPPAGHPENLGTTMIGGNIFCIPVESKHASEAWNFMVWMQSPEAQILFAHDMNNVPNQRAVLSAPQLITGPPFRHEYAKFLKLANGGKATFFPVLPVTQFYMSQMGNAFDKILYGDLTPAAGLANVRIQVQKEMDRS